MMPCRRLLPIGGLLFLTAPPAAAATDGIELDQVFIRVKQEVGYFESTNPKTEAEWQVLLKRLGLLDATTGKPLSKVCGTGRILFHVSRVKMEFTATREVSGSAEASLKVPFGPADSSLGAGGKVSSDKVSTQQITYTYYPRRDEVDPEDLGRLTKDNTLVIQPALRALRDSLIKATAHRPCFANTPKTGAEPNVFRFGVQLTNHASADAGFNFLLVSASATADHESGTGNTITVTFEPDNS
jgi:hypothetical protein